MRRVLRVVPSVAVVCLVALVGAMLPAVPANAATPYREPAGAYTLMVPDGWSKERDTTLWINGTAVFTIVTEPVAAGTTSVRFAEASVETLAELPEYTEFDRRLVLVNGAEQPLLEFTFAADDGDTVLAYMTFVTSGTTGYVLAMIVAGDADDVTELIADYDVFLSMFAPAGGLNTTPTATGTPRGTAPATPRASVTVASTPRASGTPGVGATVASTPRTSVTPTVRGSATQAGIAPRASATVPVRGTPAATPVGTARPTVSAPTTMRQPGVIRGVVLTEGGEPITGGSVTVTISGTSAGGGRVLLTATPNARGEYSEQVPNGTYTVTATFRYVDSESKIFIFPLDAVEPDANVNGMMGGVKNFRWKMTGLPPGRTPRMNEYVYYGWQLQLRNGDSSSSSETNPERAYPNAKVRVTLTPSGAFWDGSPGMPVVREVTYKESTVVDLPYANFSVSAELVEANGTVRPLVVTAGYSGTFVESAPVALRPGGVRGADALSVSYRLP